MQHRLITLAAAVLAALAALPASAQSMTPGLWEVNTKMHGNAELEKAMEQMQKQMQSMPPEQRKMMEDAMAKQGVRVAGGANGGMLVKMCMTPEMVANNDLPIQQQGNCTSSNSHITPSSIKLSFSCTVPPSHGEGVATFSGNKAYTTKIKMVSTVEGKEKQMEMEASGKWISSDCGTIKPIQAAAKAAKSK